MAAGHSQTPEEEKKVLGKYSDIDEYGFIRPRDFDFQSYENFFSEYSGVLTRRAMRWNKLLKNGKKTKVNPDSTVKKFCRKGIPMQHRTMVWMNVSGAMKRLLKNPGTYDDLLKEDYDAPGDLELLEEIKTDLDRTFPDNIHFRDGEKPGSKRSSLARVLTAVGRHKNKIGYCQGMNYITALLLLIVEKEEYVFWLMVSIIEDVLPDYYSNSLIGFRADMEVLDVLIKERYPEVSSKFEQESVSSLLFASKWFICLYADVMPTETVLRIWDCFFLEGSKVLFRVALSLIQLKSDKVQLANGMLEIVDIFRDIEKDDEVLECHSFMKKCFIDKIPLKMAHIKKLRKTNLAALESEENEKTRKKRSR